MRFWISGFSIIYLVYASLTFRNFPLSGNTPNLSLPTSSIPARARLLAESPSVRIIVHYSAFLVPASLASSSFGIPNSLAFLPAGFSDLANLASSLALAMLRIDSTTPDAKISLRNFSVNSILLPKSEALVFRVSLVCESKAGFSIKQLTNTHRFALIWWGLMTSFLFFF